MSNDDSHSKPVILGLSPARGSRLPRRLFVLAALSAGVILTCGFSWIVFALLFSPSQTKVPAEVVAIAKRMAPLHLPPEFKPTWGWEADHSVAWIQIARFDQSAGRGMLLIGELHLRPLTHPQEVDHLRNLINSSSPDMRLLTPRSTKKRDVIIRGKEAHFEIVEGEDRASSTQMRQVSGTFQGREGAAILILQAEKDFLSDEAIEKLLKSLAEADSPPKPVPGHD